jgi:hypothetical protein
MAYPALVTAAGLPNAAVAVQPGMYIGPVVAVDMCGAFVTACTHKGQEPEWQMVTGGPQPSAVFEIQPGMRARPVVLVDSPGHYA